MADLSEAERIKRRALVLVQTKGYGWSKAMEAARQTVAPKQAGKQR